MSELPHAKLPGNRERLHRGARAAILYVAVSLLVLYFSPWVGLRGKIIGESSWPFPAPEWKNLAEASGFDLTIGRWIETHGDGSVEHTAPTIWPMLGMALPIGILVVALLNLVGKMSSRTAWWTLLILGAAGAVVVGVAAVVFCPHDQMNRHVAEAIAARPYGRSVPGYSSLFSGVPSEPYRLRDVPVTQTTANLWCSVGMYGMLVVGAVVSLLPGRLKDLVKRMVRVDGTRSRLDLVRWSSWGLPLAAMIAFLPSYFIWAMEDAAKAGFLWEPPLWAYLIMPLPAILCYLIAAARALRTHPTTEQLRANRDIVVQSFFVAPLVTIAFCLLAWVSMLGRGDDGGAVIVLVAIPLGAIVAPVHWAVRARGQEDRKMLLRGSIMRGVSMLLLYCYAVALI